MWLSARLEVLRPLVKGLTNGQIADALGIASETMRKHVSLALERTGTKTRTELVGASGPTAPGPSATAGTCCETSPVHIVDTKRSNPTIRQGKPRSFWRSRAAFRCCAGAM
jgi:hypothetical protein